MPTLLNPDDSLFLIIDLQEKLINSQPKGEELVKNACKIAQTATILNTPVIVTEQYPQGLGNTHKNLKEKLPENTVYFEKTAFSCVKENGFLELLKSFKRKQIIICGIETHICVHQSINDLLILNEGFEVHLLQDVVSSRSDFENKCGIERIKSDGATLTTVETVLFELLKTAKNPGFKSIQALIK